MIRNDTLPPASMYGVHTTPEERRRRRSADPVIALGLLLDGARRRAGYSALAVADTSGLLVAGSGHFADCEELAAHAPLNPATHPEGLEWQQVHTIHVDGVQVLVTAKTASRADLRAVAAGCARILGRRRLASAAL
jgi:hypothetical protein